MKTKPKNINDCIYNLADIIRFNYCACMDFWKEDSIAKMYHKQALVPKRNYSNPRGNKVEGLVDFDCLHKIVQEKTKNNEQASDDVLSIHVRLSDLLQSAFINTIPDVNQYENLIKRAVVEHGIVKCDIYYGNHVGKAEDESQQYIHKLIKIIKKLGLEHEFISRSVDEDFCSLATSKHYLPSIRGFSWLAGTINPNNVIWDINKDKEFSWNVNARTGKVVTKFIGALSRGIEYQHKLKMANNKS